MAFILSGSTVVSYAEAADVKDLDQRVFEANEIAFADAPDTPPTLDDYIEDLATKTTDRINRKIEASTQWRSYLGFAGQGYDSNNIPSFVPEKILARKSDFTTLCAYGTLYQWILPKIADFGNPESAEVQKIQYYEKRYNDLFEELVNQWTWYDEDDDGTIEDGEKKVTFALTRRSRGKKRIVSVR